MNTITFAPKMAYKDLLIISKQNNIEIQTLIYLLNNTDIMNKIKVKYKEDLAFITRELAKTEHSLKIECDRDVLDALRQTRQVWLNKLIQKRSELEKAKKIQATLNANQ
ncbi:hypothetical protein [Myroides sp.]|uniref:hypothetical protein n=1 Tax=Myroides sp. TaxID=1874736 RepID=UPI003F3B10C3